MPENEYSFTWRGNALLVSALEMDLLARTPHVHFSTRAAVQRKDMFVVIHACSSHALFFREGEGERKRCDNKQVSKI